MVDEHDERLRAIDTCAVCECRVTAFDVVQVLSRYGRLSVGWEHHCGASGLTDLAREEWIEAWREMRDKIAAAEREAMIDEFATSLEFLSVDDLEDMWEYVPGPEEDTIHGR